MGFSTLSGGGQGADPNAYDTVVKTDTTYQVPDNPQKRVIAQNTTVTMPSSHTKGDVVLVERVGSSSVDVQPNGTESIETESIGYIEQDTTVALVSDGTDWFAVDGSDFLSAMPDTAVSVNMPSTGSNDAGDYGGWFTTSQKWSKFQARFDPGTELASDEEMVLVDTDGEELEVLEASGNSAGDVLTFSTTLSKNLEYAIFGRTPNGNARDEAYNNSFNDTTASLRSSADGNLTLTDGYNSTRGNNKDAGLIQHISEYGNINL